MRENEDWAPIVKVLGYESEVAMLTDLYTTHGMSIGDIAKRLGFSRGVICRRLLRAGIAMRGRGGPNRHVTSRLCDIPNESFADIVKLAEELQMHHSTVYKEAKRRGLCISAQSHRRRNSTDTQVEVPISSVLHSLPRVAPPPSELTLSGIEEELLREMSSSSTVEGMKDTPPTLKSTSDSPSSCDRP